MLEDASYDIFNCHSMNFLLAKHTFKHPLGRVWWCGRLVRFRHEGDQGLRPRFGATGLDCDGCRVGVDEGYGGCDQPRPMMPPPTTSPRQGDARSVAN